MVVFVTPVKAVSCCGALEFFSLINRCLPFSANIIDRGGELGVLRVREHPLNMKLHPLTAKSTPSK